jgi:hypothetical protein
MPQQIEHQNNFHFLRLMAASMVILGHVYPISGRGTFDFIQIWTNGVIPTAHLGVCIFFSVSGYLVTQSLENSSSGWSYLWKRSLRIFPGLIFSTLITILFVGALATTLPLKQYFFNSDTWRYLSVIKLYPSYTDSLPQVFKTNPTTAVNGSLWTFGTDGNVFFTDSLQKNHIDTEPIVLWRLFFYDSVFLRKSAYLPHYSSTSSHFYRLWHLFFVGCFLLFISSKHRLQVIFCSHGDIVIGH